MQIRSVTALLAASMFVPVAALAADIEVTHWWTSGGEAQAVAELAKAFDATGNKWVDGAIAGGGSTARPIMVSRIIGGDPMAATQFNHGRQAEELVQEGLMRDLTDVATAEGWAQTINPPSLLENCTLDGKIYCVPVNIHSWQWLWLSTKAFEDAGVPVPTTWAEFVAAGDALRAAGKQPLALGQQPWQASGVFTTLTLSLAPTETYLAVFGEKDAEVAAGPEMAKIFQAMDDARRMTQGSTVQDWNQATNLVITGQAGGQIMGDWAQGEFQVAGLTAGVDYQCLPALGVGDKLATGGDAFYFPLLDDEEKSKAQEVLASTLLKPETQVAFNLKKGSLPVRGDVDLSAANDCMTKGLAIIGGGGAVQSTDELVTADTTTQMNDLFSAFFNTPSMTAEDAQERFAAIIGNAD